MAWVTRPRPALSVCRVLFRALLSATYIRALAMKVGVPVVPGTPGPVDTYTDGDAFIKEYGFPGTPLTSHLFLFNPHHRCK